MQHFRLPSSIATGLLLVGLCCACSSAHTATPVIEPTPVFLPATIPVSGELATPMTSSTPAVLPGPTPRPSSVSSSPVDRGDATAPEVALVVNYGAGYTAAPAILDILAENNVPATFMVMGWVAREHPEVVRTIAARGFEVGSHGDTVFDLTEVSDAAVTSDLETADETLRPLIGRSTRPLWSPSAGAQDARVRRLASGLGYRTVLWTVDAGDWRTDASAAAVRSAVLPRLGNGVIVVLHFDSPHSADATVAALPDIVAALRQRGLRPVALSTMLLTLDARTAR